MRERVRAGANPHSPDGARAALDAEAWVGADGDDDCEPQDWEQEAVLAAEQGLPVLGLPSGMRVRVPNKQRLRSAALCQDDDDQDEKGLSLDRIAAQMANPPSKKELYCILVLFVFSLITTVLFIWRHVLFDGTVLGWHHGHGSSAHECRQCRHEWWDEFWEWRFEGVAAGGDGSIPHTHTPPPGMHWEWGEMDNHTDWLGVSGELVESVVSVYADPGPVLQIGCGDSPLAELLHKAGFHDAEHIDVVPHVIAAMQERYPADRWPGMQFRQRDFLKAGGGAAPHHFATVIDKMGIWDWLQDEAPERLPLLLDAVRSALAKAPLPGVYIIVTKQTPGDFSGAIANATAGKSQQFLVEATRPLGATGIAWSYVLMLA